MHISHNLKIIKFHINYHIIKSGIARAEIIIALSVNCRIYYYERLILTKLINFKSSYFRGYFYLHTNLLAVNSLLYYYPVLLVPSYLCYEYFFGKFLNRLSLFIINNG